MSFQAPTGPPPGYNPSKGGSTVYEPPPGPPPGKGSDEAPPPYHDWTVIPDNSLLPPPPSITHTYSSGANATRDEADRAAVWCANYPLWDPRQLSWDQLQAIHIQNQTFVTPPGFTGNVFPSASSLGMWTIKSRPGTTDSLLQTALPIYSSLADSPLLTERTKTIYFEIKVVGLGQQTTAPPKSGLGGLFHKHKHQPAPSEEVDAGVAIGFFAPPYPSFRLPGWQRGSLGVHSDDGRRYVNNPDGGLDFTSPFKPGETLGIGMTFTISSKPPIYGRPTVPKCDVEVFFTREGNKVGQWDLFEDRDVDDAMRYDVAGLEGGRDLFPAVGVFGATEVEIRIRPGEWLYRPRGI